MSHLVSSTICSIRRISHRYRSLPTLASWSVIAVAATFPALDVQAKDLYVSQSGNNNVSYANNSETTPWQTIEHGIYNLQAGDTLYIRGGVYVQNYPICVRDDAHKDQDGGNPSETVQSQSGTAANPVRVTSYPGEAVIIDLANVNRFIDLDRKDYWEFSNLEFVNALNVFWVGNTSAQHNTIRNNRIVMNRGGDNAAAISLYSPNSLHHVVDGNEIVGPGSNVHLNTGTIFMTRLTSAKILNNRLSNAPIGIHYKHGTEPGDYSSIDLEIAYNYIEGMSRNAMLLNINYANIHDNILGPNNNPINVSAGNGTAGGDFNIFNHNTFFNTTLNLQDVGNTGNTGFSGAYGNVLTNNVFMNQTVIHRYAQQQHNTSLDYNLHPQSTAVSEYGNDYGLSAWRSHYGGSVNSTAGSPVFAGGAQPATIDDYRLSAGSPGVGAASDGTDLGARVDLFGSAGTGLVRPAAPQSLTVGP